MSPAAAAALGGVTGLAFSFLGATFLPWPAWQHAATALLIGALISGCSLGGCVFGLCLHGHARLRQEMALTFGPAPGRRKVAPRSMT